ncbi:MAG: DUF1566 domain-containing protein [Polyangiaceae bacterium]
MRALSLLLCSLLVGCGGDDFSAANAPDGSSAGTAGAAGGGGTSGSGGASSGGGSGVAGSDAGASCADALGAPFPDSPTAYCTDSSSAVSCDGRSDRQDGVVRLNVPQYTSMSIDTLTDSVTSLVWQKTAKTTFWGNAEATCSSLGAGFHVPSLLEVLSIADYGRASPLLDGAFQFAPGGNATGTITTSTVGGAGHFALDFATGSYMTVNDGAAFHLRCVKGSIDGGLQPVTACTDLVRDTRTRLVWLRKSDGLKRPWIDALNHCASLNLYGKTDWRLPSVKELASLLDRSRVEGIDKSLFDTDEKAFHWTSTPLRDGLADAWTVRFGAYTPLLRSKGEENPALCVRGG